MFGTRKRLVVAAGVLTLGALGFAAPAAHAASTGSTNVTFTITAGTLSIAVPTPSTPVPITMALTAGNYVGTAQLGTTTVTDSRGGLADSVAVTASSTGFTGTASGTPALPASDGSLTAGLVTFVPGMVAATAVPVGTNLATTNGQPVMNGTTAGTGSASYNPTLTITVPQASAIADTYTGSVVQTAA